MAVKSVSIRIEKEMLDKIGFIADYEGRSVNSHILVLVRENIREFEAQHGKIEGEISSGKSKEIAGRISEAISQVQTALHKQLDALNEYRFIDLESEMDVLSDMLRSEGLTEEEKTVQAEEPEKKTEDDPFAGLFARGEK